MKVPLIDLPPSGDARLSRLLEEGWASGLKRGAVAYDPDGNETFTAAPFTFLFLPGREARPRSPDNGGGLRRPHAPCPFDAREFLDEREVVRAARGGRAYHIALNKYPVLATHYLAIRPAGDPPGTLPQRIAGHEEIEDMLHLAAALGPPYRLFFNSNKGADGSRSGSSVNHWHFQIFPTEWGVILREPRAERPAGAVEVGAIPDWPARHRYYRSRDPAPLARALWADVARIDGRDAAYNVEVAPRADGSIAALLFARAPTSDLVLPDGRTLSGDFGGIELSGNVVLPDRAVFDWVRAHPRESAAIIAARIRDGTTSW